MGRSPPVRSWGRSPLSKYQSPGVRGAGLVLSTASEVLAPATATAPASLLLGFPAAGQHSGRGHRCTYPMYMPYIASMVQSPVARGCASLRIELVLALAARTMARGVAADLCSKFRSI